MARLLVFRRNKRNRNSFAPLVAALARSGALTEFKVAFADSPGTFPRGTQILAFSFVTPDLGEVASEIRELRKLPGGTCCLVAGGPHASADPLGTLKLGFDVVFVGEGERTFPRFVEEVANGAWSGPPIRRAEGPGVDLDQAVHVDVQHHLYPFVEITRGCPHACAFCQVPLLFGRRMRHRSPTVAQHGIELAVRAGYRRFRFLTPDAFAYRGGGGTVAEALSSLLDGGARAGATEQMLGTFPSEVRPDRVSESLLHLVDQRCTNRALVVGAQSGSDRVLSLMNRGHTVEQAQRAVLAAAQAGLKPHVDLLFCFPGEQLDEQQETLRFGAWCVAEAGARLHAHVFLPLPGTPAWPKPPEKLHPEVSKVLLQLQASGQLDGDWERQALQGQQILRWRGEEKILV